MCTIIIMYIWYNTGPDLHDDDDTQVFYCTRSTWWWWYTCTCIVPDIHDDGTHVPVLYYVYQHHHVDLIQYRYMCTIIMYIWYNTGTCVPSSSCRSGCWYTCTCIVPDIHDDGTHVPVLYQIYMKMIVHILLYCTSSTWWCWYTWTCIVPDLHDDDTHVPVLYQIYMMMVHMYLYCSSSCRSGKIHVHVYHHHHVDLVQYRCMCTIIM
jgi:hypothetical protein